MGQSWRHPARASISQCISNTYELVGKPLRFGVPLLGRRARKTNFQSINIMGNHKKRRHHTTSKNVNNPLESPMNLLILNKTLSSSPLHQHSWNITRFLVVKSQEENRTMADLPPFVYSVNCRSSENYKTTS